MDAFYIMSEACRYVLGSSPTGMTETIDGTLLEFSDRPSVMIEYYGGIYFSYLTTEAAVELISQSEVVKAERARQESLAEKSRRRYESLRHRGLACRFKSEHYEP